MFFTVFDILLRSCPPESGLTQEKERHILIRGSILTIKNPSIMFINNIIEPFDTTALDVFPPIISNATIIGTNAFITVQRAFT